MDNNKEKDVCLKKCEKLFIGNLIMLLSPNTRVMAFDDPYPKCLKMCNELDKK